MTASHNQSQPTAEPVRQDVPTLKLSERDSAILHAEVRGSTAEFLGWLTGMKPPSDKEAIPPEMRPAFNRMCQRLADAAATAGEVVLLETATENASLKARAEQAEQAVDVLESNAREQAKLLADTGRRVEELERSLDNSQGLLVMVLHLGEHRRITSFDWHGEDLTKLLTDQIVENRAALSPSTPEVSR